MRLSLTVLLFLLSILASPANAQHKVSDFTDIGDSTLDDGIVFPMTLRSLIQNANFHGVPATIGVIKKDGEIPLIKIGTPLPAIQVPIYLKGDGLKLEPAPGYDGPGLVVTSNNSKIETVIIQNFQSNGLSWRGSDGLIENVTAINNEGANLQLIDAHRNSIGNDVSSTYTGNRFYGGNFGITLYRSNDNIIQHCLIGVDGAFIDLGNKRNGIWVDKCHRTIIRKNTICGNGDAGIEVDGFWDEDPANFHSSDNNIEDNFIGTHEPTTHDGLMVAIPNDNAGIHISNSTYDTIRNNIVSGNIGTGIHVQAARAGNSIPIEGYFVIENNRVGVDQRTTAAIPNGRGIAVGAKSCIVRNNIVSGNTGAGMEFNGSNNVVQSNIVGLDSAQSVAVPNGMGIAIANRFEDGHAVIGDTLEQAGNIIAGNTGDGIYVFVASTKRVILSRNMIGVNKDSIAFPNGGDGVHMKYSVREILVRENTIGANGGHGINIERNVVYYLDTTRPPFFQRPSNITIRDNCIGCVRSGDTTGRHGGSGIFTLNADTIFIDRNLISGTAGDGIHLDDSTQFVEITRNKIGPATPDEAWRIIGGDGIQARGRMTSVVTVGKAISVEHGNEIRFAKGHGILVRDSAQMVAVYSTKFVDNELGGIALDNLNDYFNDGSFNDLLDADNGSNQWQNTIDQFSGFTNGPKMWVRGKFRGKPNTAYRCDVYLAKELPEARAHRTQGTEYFDWFSFTTDPTGQYEVDQMFEDQWIAATAVDYPFATVTITGVEGTSPFSHLSVPLPPLGVDVLVKIDTQRSMVDDNGRVTLYASVMNLGGKPATTVAVRDTVSNFDLESVSISKGVSLIADSTFVATIPSLAFGEVIEYTAVGKARATGAHHRRIVAIPSENDEQPANNVDTLRLEVLEVNAVEGSEAIAVQLRLASARVAELRGLGAGTYDIRSHDLLGRVMVRDEARISAGQPLEVALEPGVNMIEISRDDVIVYRAKLLLRNR